jgi:serine/threonine-protein kinase
VKVLDFGISRMRHGLAPVTDPGIVLGTPSYMAPEQMEAAGEVGPRSDIWALGTILFELLAGRPAHNGESLPQIFVRIMRSRPPRPSQHRGDVPAALDAIVARCLAVDPDDRYATVADLARALAPFGDAASADDAARIARVFARCRAQASPVLGFVAARPRLLGAVKRVAAGAGAILVGAAAGLVLFQPHGDPEAAAAAALPAFAHETRDGGAEHAVRVTTIDRPATGAPR